MSNYNRGGSDISWAAIIIAFFLFWPVGAFLLFAKLNEESQHHDWQDALDDVKREARNVKREFQKDISDIEQQRRRYAQPGNSHYYQPGNRYQKSQAQPYVQHSARQRMGMEEPIEAEVVEETKENTKPRYNKGKGKAKKSALEKIKGGKGLMIAGGILAALFGITAASVFFDWVSVDLFYALKETLPFFFLTGVGGGMFLWGGFKNKRAREFRRLMNMIGDSKQIDIQALAEAVPCSYNQACDRLQDMIDQGILGDKAYIDMSTGYLMLDGKGLGERKAKKKAAAKPAPAKSEESAEMELLSEIRRVNEAIPDPELSRKIDRIEEITRHILDYQKKHPEKAGELHRFLDYYLPTTLKILNAYAELDKQGVDGENISTTKERIEGMMDKIVEGFETQLDKLFEGDMLDISSDISVMEKMLSRDGLSGGMRMPRPGEEPNLTLVPEAAAQPEPVAQPAPMAEPAPMPEPTPVPTPEPRPFTTPEGISLTLNPEEGAQSAPAWEDGFYRKTKEELDNQ